MAQLDLIDDSLDNPTARTADRVIELTEELKATKEKLEVQEQSMIGLLRKMKKTQIRHKGYTIKVKLTEAKEKISVKGVKQKEDQKPAATDALKLL